MSHENENDDTARLPILRMPTRKELTTYPDRFEDPAERFERSPGEPRVRVRSDRRRGDSK